MDAHELQEQTEHAHEKGQKGVGLTMAVTAVLLAVATLLSHRAHTEEVLSLTQNVDDYAFYQAKHNRAYTFALTAETQALLPGGTAAALKNLGVSAVEECGKPVPKGCVSPALKDSAVLQQLWAQSKQDAGDKSEKTADAEPPAKENHEGKVENKKEDKPAKETVVKEGAVQILERATERKNETNVIEKKATFYDGAELFLELSIVLCSVTLLSENKLFWKLSLVSSLAGVAIAVWGMLLH
ncbi:MAG TPA: DUF4337 family protein [Candidatus Angelobacter sp.]|nr:DUF4337 family protein [Candidatus Angelobacter sp.]